MYAKYIAEYLANSTCLIDIIQGNLGQTRNLKEVGKGQFRGLMSHTEDPKCDVESHGR